MASKQPTNVHYLLAHRIKYVRQVYKEMEKDLTLLGATGIEDRLQEQVVETIQKLQRAGITTWMVTGDKKETAVNLAHAAGMIPSNESAPFPDPVMGSGANNGASEGTSASGANVSEEPLPPPGPALQCDLIDLCEVLDKRSLAK